jgi:endonuclease/exonuclease/phosphatase family metal-dependent hydrolase
MRTLYLLVVFLFFSMIIFSQKIENTITILFYSTENLFDTIDAPRIDDNDYTPGGPKKWNTSRYREKIKSLAKVISEAGQDQLPVIIGLAGVENMRVLLDLTADNQLRKGNYGIIHEDGPTADGTEVALLFRKAEFTPAGQEQIRVTFPYDSSLTARNILHVYGKLKDEKEMHFFINHWSPRLSDQRESESRRMYCAVALRRNIDLLLSKDSRARIIIMGDFNDEPTNKSLMNVVQASNKRRNVTIGEFYNLMYDKHNLTKAGSYYGQSEWMMFDQILISRNLLVAVDGYRCDYESGDVFSRDWMLTTNRQGIKVPFSTYSGNTYNGGISDHLPVYVRLKR